MADNKGCEYCEGRAYTKKPVTVDYSMRTINGNWLPRKDEDI